MTRLDETGSGMLSMPAAIKYLGVSRSTLYRLIWSGRVPGHKIGVQWFFYRRDLDAMIGEGRSERGMRP